MNKLDLSIRQAERIWGKLQKRARVALKQTIETYAVSVAAGDVQYIDGGWYITHAGLLRLARRNRCAGIDVRPVVSLCNPASARWTFKAIIYKSRICRGFVGYGDADPSNVSPKVRGAEMRVAETRAVNRALRKAYAIGLCSIEELGSFSGPLEPALAFKKPVQSENSNSNGNGNGHRLRDRLCLLIRQHQLDAALVKLYAADFCDTKELRDASREQVRDFVDHLAEYAVNDRDGLLCQLASYAPKPVSEVLVTIASDSPPNEGGKAAGAV